VNGEPLAPVSAEPRLCVAAPLNVSAPMLRDEPELLQVNVTVPVVEVTVITEVVALDAVQLEFAPIWKVGPAPPGEPASLPVMVNVVPAVWVNVPVYPVVWTKEFRLVVVKAVQFALPVPPAPSKITSSPVVGTEALSAVPEAVPQLVFPVADQAPVEPPPTQYRVAIRAYS
jgi:hypothetical protein